MQSFDSNILKRNIRVLMDKEGISQLALGEKLGMSQSNVSKALNENDKKCFTLEQVIRISDYFKISIDKLIGRNRTKFQDLSIRSIAKLIVSLIESGDLKSIEHSIEEEVHELEFSDDGYSRVASSKKNIAYNCFYFPSYWHIPSDIPHTKAQELWDEMHQCGNETKHLTYTNQFMSTYLQIYSCYRQNKIDENAYRTIVENLIDHLPE